MNRQLVKLILVTAMILLLGGQSAYAIPDWSFDLLPAGGNVSGPAGATVGWGYEITNPDIVPFLIQEGFLNRTPRGRLATPNAYKHFGIVKPSEREQGSLLG